MKLTVSSLNVEEKERAAQKRKRNERLGAIDCKNGARWPRLAKENTAMGTHSSKVKILCPTNSLDNFFGCRQSVTAQTSEFVGEKRVNQN